MRCTISAPKIFTENGKKVSNVPDILWIFIIL